MSETEIAWREAKAELEQQIAQESAERQKKEAQEKWEKIVAECRAAADEVRRLEKAFAEARQALAMAGSRLAAANQNLLEVEANKLTPASYPTKPELQREAKQLEKLKATESRRSAHVMRRTWRLVASATRGSPRAKSWVPSIQNAGTSLGKYNPQKAGWKNSTSRRWPNPLKTCTVCASPKRPEIDAALVAGQSLRDVAGRFALSRSSVHRHQEHVPKALAKAKEAREMAQATTLLGRIELLIHDCRTIAQRAQRAREWSAAVSALREVRACLELLGQISGELEKEDKGSVNVNVSINMTRRALFSKMSNVEMETYAATGELPAWWPTEENGNGQRAIQ